MALSTLPQVRLHLARGAGHDVQIQASKVLKLILLEACRRASADLAYDARGLDEALVEAVPLAARRLAHWGPCGRAFAGAYLSWNLAASVDVLGEAPDAELEPQDRGAPEAVVLAAPPPPAAG
jgi:hypothetical protein